MNKKKLCLSLFASLSLVNCAGIVVPNTEACAVAGIWSAGLSCANTLSPATRDLDLAGMIEMLEPQPERPDPANPGQNLPARAGAIIQSAEDWNKMKTALEQGCKLLKRRCTYEMKEALRQMTNSINQLQDRVRMLGR